MTCSAGDGWLVSDKAGIELMSHLSIPPAIFTDLERLKTSLRTDCLGVNSPLEIECVNYQNSCRDLIVSLPSVDVHLSCRREAGKKMRIADDLQRNDRHPIPVSQLQRVAQRRLIHQAPEPIGLIKMPRIHVSVTSV